VNVARALWRAAEVVEVLGGAALALHLVTERALALTQKMARL
jgi:hypothetical protein